jgi:hypothetical protein
MRTWLPRLRKYQCHPLRLPEGATVDEVASVTGWQRHTVRGVFSGTLKKKLGLTLASAKEERGRVYRIAEPASLCWKLQSTMLRLASTLASRPPFSVQTTAGRTGCEARTWRSLNCEIAGLVDRSTEELRRAWRALHHIGPPLGLSRDLIIRGLADKLQQRAHGGPSRALQRRLRILAGEFEKGARSFHPGGALKSGATLVRQWRGHTHTVLVREDGFEYDGQRYRSLTVIAERITGAHWSGPRFFGLNKRAGES